MSDLTIPGLQDEIAHTRRAIANGQMLVNKLCAIANDHPNPPWMLLQVIMVTKSDLDHYREYLARLEGMAYRARLPEPSRNRLLTAEPVERRR